MDQSTIGIIAVNILGFVSVIATQLFQSSNTKQDRQWAREEDQRKLDAAAQSIKEDLRVAVGVAQKEATLLAAQLVVSDQRAEDAVKSAVENQAQFAVSQKKIEQLVIENTRLTQEAIHTSAKAIEQGNNFNKKLHEVGLTIAKRASDSMERVGDKPTIEAPVNVVLPKENHDS